MQLRYLLIFVLLLSNVVLAEQYVVDYTDSVVNTAFQYNAGSKQNYPTNPTWANPYTSVAAVSANAYSNLSTSNNVYAQILSGGTNRDPSYTFNMSLNISKHVDNSYINWILLTTRGSETGGSTGENAYCHLANFSGSSWRNVINITGTALTTSTFNITSSITNYISSQNRMSVYCWGDLMDSGEGLRMDYISLTVDYTIPSAPVISQVLNWSINQTAVKINWTTDLAANGSVKWGTTLALTGGEVSHTNELTKHNLNITTLSPNTLYYYNITSCTVGGCTTSGTYNFTTSAFNYAPSVVINFENNSVWISNPILNFTGTDPESDSITYDLELFNFKDEWDFWDNEKYAFDEIVDSGFTSTTNTNHDDKLSNYTYGYLSLEGIKLPTSIDSISSVRVRISGTDVLLSTQTLAGAFFIEDELLGTCLSTTSATNYGSSCELSAPSGGWSESNLRSLEIRLYSNYTITAVPPFSEYDRLRASAVEINITTASENYTYIVNATLINVTSAVDSGFSSSPDNTDPFASGQLVNYTLQETLQPGVYYWRVRGKDPDGSNTWGNWSSISQFNISGAPDNLNIVNFNATPDNTGTTNANWSAVYSTTQATGGNFSWFNTSTKPIIIAASFDADLNARLDLTDKYFHTVDNVGSVNNVWTYQAGGGRNGSGAWDLNSNNAGTGNEVNFSYTGQPTAPFFVEISFKFKSNPTNNNLALIGQYATTPTARMWQIMVNGSNNIRTLTSDDATRTDVVGNSSLVLTPGSWYHLVWVYDTTHTRIYLNGNLIANVDRVYDGIYNGNQHLRLGAWWTSGPTNQGNFTYDYFIMGSYNPSTTQITEWYNAWNAGRPSRLMSTETETGQSWQAWLAAANTTDYVKANYNFTIQADDTCTYSGSGDWTIMDNCVISSDYNLAGNRVFFQCPATVTITSGGRIRGWTKASASGGCKVTTIGGRLG